MTREQLIDLAKKISDADGTEEEADKNIELFLKNVSDPNAMKYFFNKKFEGLTLEEIVDKSLDYKPFQL